MFTIVYLEEDKPPHNKGNCPRLIWFGLVWLASANERLAKLEQDQIFAARKADKKKKKLIAEKEREESATAFMNSAQTVQDDDPTEDDFVAPISSKGTRQSSAVQQEWPEIEAKDGYRKMNVKVMEVLVSTYKVSENKAAACLQMVLNTLCSQNLLLPSPQVVEMEDDADSSSTRTWTVGDLPLNLPTPQTIHKWNEDGAIVCKVQYCYYIGD